MKIIVQKFGGTSISNQESRENVVDRVTEAIENGFSPVVVVSAMGRKGDPYATDTLRSLPLSIFPDMCLREMDMLMSCGEIISAVIISATLNRAGIKTRVFSGGQAGLICDGNFGDAEIIKCDPAVVFDSIKSNEVPVIAGFQGQTADGDINTMGRGGSDTTAVILGAALEAEKVEIYTDVSGVMTADPSMVSAARLIDRLSYSEVLQMAYEGTKVIHPRAVEVAMQNGVKLVVKNPKEKGTGTIITSAAEINTGFASRGRRAVTGIAHTLNLAQVVVDLPVANVQVELSLFENLAAAGVNIDLINVFPNLKVFAVNQDNITRTKNILEKLSLSYRIESDCGKVSLVGAGMRNIPGVMAKVVKALADQEIEILQTSDSNITISLLLHQEDISQAVIRLHEYFHLETEGINNRRWTEDIG